MGISRSDFDYIRMLVRQQAAIVIEDGKEYFAETRLAPVLKAHNLPSIEALVRKLRTRSDDKIARAVVEAMAIHETLFFRDVPAYNLLREHILPEIIAQNSASRSLTIWCGAASTGQEPYSVAIVLREYIESHPELAAWSFRLIASDLSTAVLERARTGRYNMVELNRGLPARYLVKYFDKTGLDWQANQSLRALVDYQCINLLEPWPSLPVFDIVFLRNVLIYFDPDVKREILRRLRGNLRPGGYALFGAAETISLLDPMFEALLPITAMWCRLRS